MKNFNRRQMGALALTTTLCMGAVSSAWAQEWMPTKPVRIIVPITGSTNDVLARLIAPKLQEVFGQPFVVENKPGAGGNIGADMVKDLAPITLMVKAPQYLVVNPASGITSVKDFVEKTKANPAKYSYGSVALGSASHLTMEMFKSAAGFQITHIPYRGAGPAVGDLIAGNIQAGFFVPGNVQQFAKEGRLKLLATSGLKRFATTPDIPTLSESGYPDFEATSWIGFLTTGGTPAPIIERYNREIVKIVRSPEITKRLLDMEFEIVATTPNQFRDWIGSEIKRWGKVIKDTGTTAE